MIEIVAMLLAVCGLTLQLCAYRHYNFWLMNGAVMCYSLALVCSVYGEIK